MQDLPRLMGQVFPLGNVPNYEPLAEESIAGIAEVRDQDVMEVMYDLLVDNDGKELFINRSGATRVILLMLKRNSLNTLTCFLV